MTPYDKNQIWTELKRLERSKANLCPVRDMNSRINYLETTNNDLTQRVARLEDDIQTLDNEAAALTERFAALQERVQSMGDLLKHDRPDE